MAAKTIVGAVGSPIPHDSGHLHVSGEALYTDDIAEPRDMLHLAVGMSAKPHAGGMEWNEETVRTGIGALNEDFSPISDMRSTADYRRTVCGNLLKRFYLDSSGSAVPRVYDYGR